MMTNAKDTTSLHCRFIRLFVAQLMSVSSLMIVAATFGLLATVYSSAGFLIAAITVGCIAVVALGVVVYLVGMYVGACKNDCILM